MKRLKTLLYFPVGMLFEDACAEIAQEIENENCSSKKQLNSIKHRVLGKYPSLGRIPKNADIYFAASKHVRKTYKDLLGMKPVRTLSGVAPIALMSDPYPCPHTLKDIGPCTYCPGGPGSPFGDVPQSYTGEEPSTKRSIRHNYDPYLIVFNRLEHYIAMDKIPDKAELIIQGGTFPFFPKQYQEYFVKYCFKAMNDFSALFFSPDGSFAMNDFKIFFELPKKAHAKNRTERINKKLYILKQKNLSQKETLSEIKKLLFNPSFEIENHESSEPEMINIDSTRTTDPNVRAMLKAQKKVKQQDASNLSLEKVQVTNESSFIRCVGMTIETKSDYGKLREGNVMLDLGCTRVEVGIQSVYDEVLQATHRGNTVQDNIESIRILRDLGFKINTHYMPGLPKTTTKMDQHGLAQLFDNPDYRPDMIKVYPCMVMPGTKLYDDWKKGMFTPIKTQNAAELIGNFMAHVPTYCRVMRVQRDIPTNVTSDGVDKTNLRQYIDQYMQKNSLVCRDIRAREAGLFTKSHPDKAHLLSLDNINIIVTKYEASSGTEFFISAEDIKLDVLFGFIRLRFPSQLLREEITSTSALVREIHIFSNAVQIGKQDDDSFQHKGIGRALLRRAEEVAKENAKDKIVVISGVGARNYFRKWDYEKQGPYMVKEL